VSYPGALRSDQPIAGYIDKRFSYLNTDISCSDGQSVGVVRFGDINDNDEENNIVMSLRASPGAFVAFGFGGVDHIYGGQGNNFLYGGMGDDVLVGGSGNNLRFSAWQDVVRCVFSRYGALVLRRD